MRNERSGERVVRSAEERRRSVVLIVLVALGLAAMLAAVAASIWFQNRNATDTRWVEHTLQVEARLSSIAALNEQAEAARRGYLLRGDDAFRGILERASTTIQQMSVPLAKVVADNRSQRMRAATLVSLSSERAVEAARITALVQDGRRATAVRAFGKDPGTLITLQIRALVADMIREEQGLLNARSRQQHETLKTLYGILLLTALLITALSIAILAILLRNAKMLAASNAELAMLNEHLEDEVAHRTSELQQANAEIQRFAYIVSHDLRSPLVNIMGFTAELDTARKDIAAFIADVFAKHPEEETAAVRVAIEEDLPEALDFIRSSTAKMDRLINAILKISREGQRRLTAENLDMNALVQGVIDSLHQRALSAGATITAEDLPMVQSDRIATEQVLSNIIENAVKYLKPGRPGEITVSAERAGMRTVYAVKDNGRGIDPRDHERIFELFRRSGVQDQPGEGLGLAHVRALAYRLGGTVDVESEVDRGTTFRLSLPRELPKSE